MAIDPALWRDVAATTVVPALTVGLVLSQPWRAARPLAVGLGFATAFVIGSGLPGAPWTADVKASLAWIALTAALLAAVACAVRPRVPLFAPARLPALAAASFLVVWYLLDFMREHHWDRHEGWLWSLALAAGLAAVTRAKGLPLERPRWEAALVRGAECGLLAGLLHQGRSTTLALLAATLGVCQAMAEAAAPRAAKATIAGASRAEEPEQAALGAAGMTAGLLYGGLVLAGVFSAELSWHAALALVVVPHVPRVVEATRVGHRSSLRLPATLLLQGLLVALAAWWVWHSTPVDPYAAYR